MNRAFILPGAIAIGLTACGGVSTSGEAASTQAAILAAEEVGAEEPPSAALHLKYAHDQRTQADKLIEAGENESAVRVLKRARADAELAMALSRSHAAQEKSKNMLARVDELRQRAESQMAVPQEGGGQ